MNLKTQKPCLLVCAILPITLLSVWERGIAAEPAATPIPKKAAAGPKEASPISLRIDPALDAPFFHKEVSSLPWHIVVHDDGHLEDTLGGDPKKARKIRHTAEVTSNSRGPHTVTQAEAWWEGHDLVIHVHEFNAAYADDLTLRLTPGGKNVTAQYQSPSPAPGHRTWQVTQGSITLQSWPVAAATPSTALRGKIDFTILETDAQGNQTRLAVKGNIKPLIK